MTTNATHYYQPRAATSIDCAVGEHNDCMMTLTCTCRCHDQPTMTYREPTVLERSGETIVAILGAVVFGFALGILTVGLVAS